VPRVGALRSLAARVRANPWLAVGIAAAAILVAAWLGWAIYVASDRGVNEGLGVLIAWPAMVVALALISLPLIGGYLLIRRLLPADNAAEGGDTAEEQPEDEAPEGDEELEDESGEEEEDTEDGSEDEEEESEDEESEAEPEAAKG
jgi:hypothetical protein